MAINMVFPKELKSAVLSKSFIYQSKVNPFQLKYGFDVAALKELTTITIIGRNKNRYASVYRR